MATTIGSLDLNAFSDLYSDSTQYFWFEGNASATYGAGVHVTLVPDTTFISNPTGQNILMNTDGFSIRNGLLPMMTLDNDSLDFNVVDTTAGTYVTTATFTSTGAQIGQSSGAHSVIDADGQRFYASNGSTLLANIGYGEGASQGGTAIAPYYTFGTRASNSTIGNYSMAEGFTTTAMGYSSHAEGQSTTAMGYSSHAEGLTTTTMGAASHAEGSHTTASVANSHAEGNYTTAGGTYSHAQNLFTVATENSQTVIGKYNSAIRSGSGTTADPYTYSDAGDYAFIIGNGTDDTTADRSNALTVDWDGNVIGQAMAGIIQMYAGATPPTGWLVCDGASYLRSDYPTLFEALGGTSSPWGLPDSTHFQVPDLRGRAPIGAGTGSGLSARTLGTQDIGSENIQAHTHSFTQPKTPNHTHTMTYVGDAASNISGTNPSNLGSVVRRTTSSSDTTNWTSNSTGGGVACTGGAVGGVSGLPSEQTTGNAGNMQPSAVVNFIICTGKTY